MKNLTSANERCVAFENEIVIKNRVCVGFSEKSVWSVSGGRRREAPVCDDEFNRVEHIQWEMSSKVCGWGDYSGKGGNRRVRRVGIAHPVEESVGFEWCDVTFDFFSGVSMKVSGEDVGFVTRVIRVSSKSVKKFIEVTFVRNIYTRQSSGFCHCRMVTTRTMCPRKWQRK